MNSKNKAAEWQKLLLTKSLAQLTTTQATLRLLYQVAEDDRLTEINSIRLGRWKDREIHFDRMYAAENKMAYIQWLIDLVGEVVITKLHDANSLSEA